jgi:cytidylate kinase
MIIAIDGPAASGKGTIARRIAAHYRLPHLDTGLLYRATAAALIAEDRELYDEAAAVAVARTGLPISTTRPCAPARWAGGIRGRSNAGVRSALIEAQRLRRAAGSAVLDGRDIARSLSRRGVNLRHRQRRAHWAQRRARQIGQHGEADYNAILARHHLRDARDSNQSGAVRRLTVR